MQAGRTVAQNRAEAFPLGSSVTIGELDADPHPLLARPFRLDAVRRLDPERPSVVSGLVFRKPQTLHVVWG